MSADPFAGDPGAVKKLSGALTDHQDDIRRGATRVARTADDTDDWTGAAKDRFAATVSTIPSAAHRIIGRLDAAIDVLDTYADAVRRIQDEAERIRAAQLTNAVDAAANVVALTAANMVAAGENATEADGWQARRLQSDADDLAATASRLQEEWDDLVERRAAADRAAASALSDTDVLGVALSYAGSLGAMSDAGFLAAVVGMPPEVLAAQGRPVADRLAGMPPDTVRAWWDGLGGRGSAGEHSAAQDALITALPAVVGNLNGVPYWARDQANRVSAQRAYARAEDSVRAARKALKEAVGRTAQQAAQKRLNDALTREKDLKNFVAGARKNLQLMHDVPRQMVSFSPTHPPIGAFSVGDLDTADSVSYLVPGMGSSLKDTTQCMAAASNVVGLHQASGSKPDTAMVTWLGYEAPPNFVTTGNRGVFGEAYADAGAQNLAADLEGFRATRPETQLDVVAHSYGSTVAAIALHDHPDLGVHSLVTLGSAGIPASVPDAAATHAEHMYAAQAVERWDVAYIGRKYSMPHRLDPADDFGATRISTFEGNRVNVHDLTVHSPENPDYGYLDEGTNSLLTVARVTLP
ncbi:alpha/beta hydrolase [Curtobacterium sp. 458]|uniref:alpha/beta hydrolase n=1 Tax=Curtobacterium sp. 458 TaxID=3050069 RepID=UPI0025B34383|nr:alpha/beta hydrolase [Curtobacterium sp. 458]WJX99870.1 alpha/beta hydrolase [Curtobacterium sp. 458]